ncbi:MAG: Dam family site-specific DNA-(adenine-N6)-methyltransferase [Mycoplasmataceae bacterium]|nr:Dam family site-specific DNA-(adenine-N6)-methyltransferase [Mycoplasmataceae bacterium]
MNPILKWPGGKRRELKQVENMIPSNTKLIVEPFFGGGAFSLKYIDEYDIVASDIDEDLVYFYNATKSPSFLKAMKECVIWWDENQPIEKAPKLIRDFADGVKEINRKNDKYIAYYAIRAHYNKLRINNKFNNNRAILFYLLRELCFSSMFRFNSMGEFNVPYGGLSYNKKNMMNKYELILEFSKKNLNIINSDFSKIITENKENKDALIFLDPPYDSVFTDYNSYSFGRKEQTKLRDSLIGIDANFILIINKTDFIHGIYGEIEEFNIGEFDKKYSVNFKNRNEQSVKHLIIRNFEEENND